MTHEPLEPAFSYYGAPQQDGTTSAETAGRLEQARTAALLGITESLARLASALEGPDGLPPAGP